MQVAEYRIKPGIRPVRITPAQAGLRSIAAVKQPGSAGPQIDIDVDRLSGSSPERLEAIADPAEQIRRTVLPEAENGGRRLGIDRRGVWLLLPEDRVGIDRSLLAKSFAVTDEVHVYGRFAHLEYRFGEELAGDPGLHVVGKPLRLGIGGESRKVDTVEFEAIVAVRLDEVKRSGTARQRLEGQREGGFARRGHPEKRIGSDAIGTDQPVFAPPGREVAAPIDPDPVVGLEIGLHAEHGGRIGQFDPRNIERHGVRCLDQRILDHPFTRRTTKKQASRKKKGGHEELYFHGINF